MAAVLLFHARLPPFSGGFAGVDVFFAISGYLITANIARAAARGEFAFGAFYAKRARRLFPALYATVAATFVAGAFVLPADDFRRLGKSVVAAVLSFSNAVFWLESGYFDTGADAKALLHTWSLSVEEQFYALWPVVLVAALTLNRRVPGAALAAVIVIFGVSLAAACFGMSLFPSAVFFLAPFRAYEFMMGAVLVWLPPVSSRAAREGLAAGGLAMVAAPIVLYTKETVFPGLSALIPCGGASLLIYSGGDTLVARALSGAVPVFIGRISYSIYLVHWPLIVLYQFRAGKEVLTAAEGCALSLGSVALAVALFYLVETRFRKPPAYEKVSALDDAESGETQSVELCSLGAGKSLRLPRQVFVLILASLLLIIPALSAYLGDGWKWRIPKRASATVLNNAAPNAGPVRDSLTLAKLKSGVHEALQFAKRQKKAKITAGVSGGILLIGDSHARRLQAFARYFAGKHSSSLEVKTVNGCTPIFGVRKVYPANPTPGLPETCAKEQKAWEAEIRRANYSHVILSGRWEQNYEPAEFGEFRRQPVASLVPINNTEKNPKRDRELSKQLFESSLRYTVQTIQKTGTHVLIVSQPPVLESVPSWCLLGTQPPGAASVPCVWATREQALSRVLYTNEVIRKVAAAFPKGVTELRTSDYFCDNRDPEHCLAYMEDQALYENGNHINDYGAIYLAKRWEQDPNAVLPWSVRRSS